MQRPYHYFSKYLKTLLFIFPKISDTCGQELPVLPFYLLFPLFPLPLSFSFSPQNSKKMIYLGLSHIFVILVQFLVFGRPILWYFQFLFSGQYHVIRCTFCYMLLQLDIFLEWNSLSKPNSKYQRGRCHF